jgi:uncharacterized membrane protein
MVTNTPGGIARDGRSAGRRIEAATAGLFTLSRTASTGLLVLGLLFWAGGGAIGLAPLFLETGLVLLMVKPVLRVIVSLALALAERDWLFVSTASVVLAGLALSLLVAMRSAP